MAQTLSQKVRPILRDIIVENGRTLMRDRARLNSFLRDLCPDCNAEIQVLLAAVDEGIPEQLLTLAEPAAAQIAALAGQLGTRRGLAAEDAGWAVNAWVFALGVRVKGDAPKPVAVQPPATPPVPNPTVPARPIVPRAPLGDSGASRNRSDGWKRLYISLLLLFFIGGGGVWAMANQSGSDTLNAVLFTICGILALSALSGLYKIVTGR